ITGDGEMLMGTGSLITVGKTQPRNLAIAVLDNESYGETGMQQSHTAQTADLAALARAAGILTSETVADEHGVAGAIDRLLGGTGPVFVDFKVRAESLPLVMPPKEGPLLKERFRRALSASE
ncbi:MAG: thiamine pyrophosphate-dependent enzyme, partial [Rhodospirillales bacterium]|nr:thiamine pyrophosphate-dependent enzyme [Rhodospirillales bacterium]